jgi:hypothetical protein
VKLNKRLIVNGRPVTVASDYVRLRLSHVGEGIFEVPEELEGLGRALVEFYVGVGGGEEYLMLTGALTETRRLAPGRVRLAARELSAVLEMPLVINLMHPTARQVLARIEHGTGLRFLLPARADYLDERRVDFRSYKRGVDALNLLGKKWELAEAVWFQLPDGRMYWGHWAQGPYTKGAVPIEPHLISARDDKNRTLVLPYIPALRPGMVVEAGFRFRIDGLTFSGDTVNVEWKEV